MKAMILAAGLGTRLRPLTNDRPKALVEVDGRTMLDLTLSRLHSFGVTQVIVNTHHFFQQMISYVFLQHRFDMKINLSQEEVLLDTGGGLKKAAWFFQEPASDEPFILHNVDVLSNIDLARMLRFHIESEALATLAVQDRPTSRNLLFDESGLLCGRRTGHTGLPELVRDAANPTMLAFSGIHILSPRIFSRMTEDGAFSIIKTYLRLASEGERIQAFRADEFYWRDLGRPESVAQAAEDIRIGLYPFIPTPGLSDR